MARCSTSLQCVPINYRRGTTDVLWFVLFPHVPSVSSVGFGVFSPAIKKRILNFHKAFSASLWHTKQILRSGCQKQSFYFCTLACHQVIKAHCFSLVFATWKLCVLKIQVVTASQFTCLYHMERILNKCTHVFCLMVTQLHFETINAEI